MLIIKGEDFEMEQVKASPFFDLSMLSTVNEGKSNERKEMKLVGYGMTLESAIKVIIVERLAQIKKSVSLEEYIKYYRKYIDKFIETVKVDTVNKEETIEENGE